MKQTFLIPQNPNDIDLAFALIKDFAKIQGLTFQILGTVGAYPLIFLTPKKESSKKRVLVAAGFHGNEYAGVWGLINYLENGERFDNVSFLPLVNPIALKENRRYGKDNKISNQGFCHPEMNLPASDEGKVLIEHAKLISSSGADGFISLHEAPEKGIFYVYAFENSAAPSGIPLALLKIGTAVFGAAENGTTMQYGGMAKDGVIFNYHDSSFEDFMFENGVPHSIVTETPVCDDLGKRIRTNYYIIEAFVRLIQEGTVK